MEPGQLTSPEEDHLPAVSRALDIVMKAISERYSYYSCSFVMGLFEDIVCDWCDMFGLFYFLFLWLLVVILNWEWLSKESIFSSFAFIFLFDFIIFFFDHAWPFFIYLHFFPFLLFVHNLILDIILINLLNQFLFWFCIDFLLFNKLGLDVLLG